MTERDARQAGRVVGLVYLVTVVTGIYGLMYLPSQIGVAHDLAGTIDNIRASTQLYRSGVAASMICYASFAAVPLLIYPLVAPAGRRAAALMVVFGAINVPIALLSIARKLDILALLARGGSVAPTEQDAVQRSLDAYHSGMLVGDVFAGLWLIPFGYLVIRSAILPRMLGVLLVIGGAGYLLDVFGQVLSGDYSSSLLANYDTLPAGIAEVGTCFWLIVFGAKLPRISASARE